MNPKQFTCLLEESIDVESISSIIQFIFNQQENYDKANETSKTNNPIKETQTFAKVSIQTRT